MERKVFVGCDVGTSSAKAIICDVGGKILAESSVSYGLMQKEANWAEQNVDIYVEAAIRTISEVIQKSGCESVEAICISALYSGSGVLCDKNMQAIRPVIIWMDRRAEEEGKELREQIGINKIFGLSGNGIDSYFGYTKLLWIKKHEKENWERTACILPVHSYIVYKLTGKISIDYCAAGNLGGIYDYRKHTWSEEMCDLLGIPLDLLPQKIYSPTDIVGSLHEDFLKTLGLKAPVKICAGTVDCISAMLSAGIKQEGDNAAILGTSLNWGILHTQIPEDANLVSMPYCNNPLSMSYTYGGASTAGALPRWFVNTFIGKENAEVYAELERGIQERDIAPGSEGLTVLPYFMGERTPIWDENASGVIFGLSLSHTKYHIYNAVLESVAYSLLHIMESMKKGTVSKIVMVGGGTKSVRWLNIFADVTGLPVYVPSHAAEAPLGDAFLAAYASGNIESFEALNDWVHYTEAIYPDKDRNKQYKILFKTYKELYPALKLLMGERMNLLKEKRV